MSNEEIVSMSVSEYCDLLITMAEFAGSNDPHKVSWDYTFWHGVVSEERYTEVIPALVERGFESWMA
jgi:hypothetical protein